VGRNIICKPDVTITDINLHHVAVTKSGSAVVFYVDGVAYPAAAYDPGFTFSEDAFIGGLGNNYTFYGTVDEVSVYSRALAANDHARARRENRDAAAARAPAALTRSNIRRLQANR
jgi:hypothetical protein